MTLRQVELFSLDWTFRDLGEIAHIRHGDQCGGAVVLSRSEPNRAVDRARCLRCGWRWERRDARCKWRPAT